MVATEGIDYKTRCEHLLSTLRKKEKKIEELEEKCISFENRALSLEQENDSLRLASKIIVQEKNECDSRPQKADDCWSLVENTHATNRTKTKRNQQTIPNDNTIDLASLEMRLKVVSSMLAQRQITNLIKTEETGYQARDAPRLKILEAARIEQREPQTVPGMIQQINRQREKKCL